MKKKLFVLGAIFCIFNSQVFAYELESTKNELRQKNISEIGFNILNANRIDHRVVFYYDYSNKSRNAFARSADKAVTIQKGLVPFLDSDDEYAAILCHEIAHQMDFYEGGPFIGLAMTFQPKKYEKKADKRAVDFMVKAGYNPLALIVVMNKSFGQLVTDFGGTHPLVSKRLAYVYEYIYRKYPAYLAHNAYKNNLYYQNFLLTSRKNRTLLEAALKREEESNKIIKINYK